jgi:fructose-bisphosphate aldolase class II
VGSALAGRHTRGRERSRPTATRRGTDRDAGERISPTCGPADPQTGESTDQRTSGRADKRVVDRAHAKGIVVEAELGMLGGVEEDIQVSDEHASLTDPEQAVEFVERTGCDSLAVAIGTSHGAYKFAGGQGLHFDRIEAIQKLLPGFPLVMHGSSSVPKEWVDRINEAGGDMPGASGVPEDQYLPAAKLGVTKVNIDTDGRLVWCAIHREFFRDKPAEFDLRGPGKPFMTEYAKFIAHKNGKLGSAGQLSSVRDSLAVTA